MSAEPLGQVHIGAREIYDQLLQTDRKVDQIGNRVEQLATAHAEQLADHEARIRTLEVRTTDVETNGTDLVDHENRIRTLERGRWPLPAIASLIGIASLVVAILSLLKGT